MTVTELAEKLQWLAAENPDAPVRLQEKGGAYDLDAYTADLVHGDLVVIRGRPGGHKEKT